MKMKKEFLSILLCLVMVLGLMPGMSLTAYAEGEETPLTAAKIAPSSGSFLPHPPPLLRRPRPRSAIRPRRRG